MATAVGAAPGNESPERMPGEKIWGSPPIRLLFGKLPLTIAQNLLRFLSAKR